MRYYIITSLHNEKTRVHNIKASNGIKAYSFVKGVINRNGLYNVDEIHLTTNLVTDDRSEANRLYDSLKIRKKKKQAKPA